MSHLDMKRPEEATRCLRLVLGEVVPSTLEECVINNSEYCSVLCSVECSTSSMRVGPAVIASKEGGKDDCLNMYVHQYLQPPYSYLPYRCPSCTECMQLTPAIQYNYQAMCMAHMTVSLQVRWLCSYFYRGQGQGW
jgi:hypothetical protein